MILARLSKAVREQNWFAVTIEFVIVILGVVIGFQISAWNETRQERALTRVTLERLQDDFTDIVAEIEDDVASIARTIEVMTTMREALQSGQLSEEDRVAFDIALQRAYTHREPANRSSTFVEIESNGRMALIGNERLRRALRRYDENVSAARETFLHARLIQTEYMRPFTRQFDTDPGAERQPGARYDFAAMAADAEFQDAAEQLAAMQHVYLAWHRDHLDRANAALSLLDAALAESAP